MVETLFYLNKNTFIVLVITLYKRRQEFWSVNKLCFNLLLQRLSKNCTIFLLYCWLKRHLTGVFWCCYSVLSAAGFDMPLMLLWACMLSSHFSPQKFSTVTLQTVPGSRQCGATPLENNNNKRELDGSHMNKKKKGTLNGKIQVNINEKLGHCGFHDVNLLAVGSRTVSIRVGPWSVETLNPTGFTEGVFCSVSVKRVCCQIIWPLRRKWKTVIWNIEIFKFKWPRSCCLLSYLYEFELIFWNNEMMVLFLCANATTEKKDSSGYFVCQDQNKWHHFIVFDTMWFFCITEFYILLCILAVENMKVWGTPDFKSNSTTMAAASMFD